uniref:Endoglucanase n=1 Tax=uncultured bacterium contig00081 TaxID=1181557 RepID=A0A806K0L2_9BACT|nr:cellulase [uncultured bacterium contig00081]
MKRIIPFILALCLLAGCGSSGNGNTETPAPPDAPAVEAPAQPTEPEPKINWGGDVVSTIRADQLGYRPGDTKKAAIITDDTTFEISRAADGVVVLGAALSEPMRANAADETVRVADFSALAEPGEYFLVTSEGRSYPFVISDSPYGDLRAAVLEMFHYQKCGVEIEAGIWSHPECHAELATIFDTEDTKDVSGGWHDAGDYGRYVVPAAKAIADLLLAYENAPNPDPEALPTAWHKIEWMLKMQDEATGGVYHKVTCRSFPALDIMPQGERNPLVLSPISPTATADFAASMALAARFYPEQREALLAAAISAWEWCEANPDAPGFRNPPRISTGEYGDSSSKDERFWAACELFAATGDEKYHDYIKSDTLYTGFGWQAVGSYGLVAYLFGAGDKADGELYAQMKDKLLADCEGIMGQYAQNPYGDSMGGSFPWGSSMNVANNAVTLILGSRLADKPEYVEAALDHMHYLLGYNSLAQSFITGYGAVSPQNPHHRPSVAAGAAVPGMVVGGPESGLSDPALKAACEGFPAAKRYIDDKESYASNEITIYWNSPVYFALALLDL